jgi:[acyl-carrier-protein] S-malonyltransferase
MGKKLYDAYASARQVFEEAEDTLGYKVSGLCFEGSLEQLTLTEYTQPALLTLSVAAYNVYMEEIGVSPAYAAGHSLGEFSALACAGVLRFADALTLVRSRGQLMQEAANEGTGAMCAVIGMPSGTIEAECGQVSAPGCEVVVSNYNSPEQIVISGHQNAVRMAGQKLEEKGARLSYLKVSAPFHSPLMAPAAAKFEAELRRYQYGSFQWPVLSNVTGEPYTDPAAVAGNLLAQMTSPVRWDTSMQYLRRMGVEKAIELGPQKVLTNLMRGNVKEIVCYPFEQPEQLTAIRQHLDNEIRDRQTPSAAYDVNNIVTKCLTAAVSTRNTNWDNEAYRKGVIEPYRAIQTLQEQLDRDGGAPDYAQMSEALRLLKLIFDTKGVSAEEQRERFNEMVEETGTRVQFSHF